MAPDVKVEISEKAMVEEAIRAVQGDINMISSVNDSMRQNIGVLHDQISQIEDEMAKNARFLAMKKVELDILRRHQNAPSPQS